MSTTARGGPILIVTADDYGYAPGYDRGILDAVRAGAVDAVSAMVGRGSCTAEPLLETGIEIGLHLELADTASGEIGDQVERFERLFARPPAFLDGHHHCHARDGVAPDVAALAAARRIPVRSVDARHRRLLHEAGIPTPDRLIGRLDPSEPVLPPLLAAGRTLPAGVTEWMVHPGYADPRSGSAYDEAREHDLDLLLRVAPSPGWGARRAPHAAALGVG
jgi:chitin disaccharide deacetylase